MTETTYLPDSADDSLTPGMSPVAVAYEIVRDTISQYNAYGTHTTRYGASAHSDNAALARSVVEALTVHDLLVTA